MKSKRPIDDPAKLLAQMEIAEKIAKRINFDVTCLFVEGKFFGCELSPRDYKCRCGGQLEPLPVPTIKEAMAFMVGWEQFANLAHVALQQGIPLETFLHHAAWVKEHPLGCCHETSLH
jgi:hypothetical protein